MSLYSAFGLSIASELPLPELPPGSGPPSVFIRRGFVSRTAEKASRREQIIFGTRSGAFHVIGGREIIVDPLEGVDDAAVRIVLLGRVMACLLWQRGWLPLHASGVAIGGEAVLFVGPSGAGKSTIAAALHARGHHVIGDDVSPVKVEKEGSRVLPAWPRLRLFPDSMRSVQISGNFGIFDARIFQVDKYSISLGQPRPSPLRLSRIYVLDFGPELRSDVVPPFVAAATLNTHSLLGRRCDTESAALCLKDCVSLVQSVPIRHLSRPRDLDFLPNLAQFIEEDSAVS